MYLEDFYYEEDSYGYYITGLKNKELKNVIIPEGVYEISKDAFSETDIESVHFSKSVEVIDDSAFWLCKNLKRVTFDENSKLTTVGEYAFCSCQTLEGIILPQGVTTIYSYAFMDCEEIEEFTVPSGVTLMKACIFEECFKLKKITVDMGGIPSSWHKEWNINNVEVVLTRPASEFVDTLPTFSVTPTKSRRTKLKKTVTDIKKERAELLKKFIVQPVDSDLGNGFMIMGLKNKNDSLTELSLPSSVASICQEAFKGQASLKKLVATQKLTDIQPRAFYGCTSLKEVSIPPKTTVMREAFRGCTSLEKFHIDENIQEGAFIQSGLKEVTFDSKLTTVKALMFYSCQRLEHIKLTEGINYISSNAFASCSNLKSVEFSPNIEYIEEDAFSDCESLTEIELPKNLTWLMERAFYGCKSLKSVKINERLTQIKSGTFIGCEKLASVTIPKNILFIENRAFDGNYLKEVIIEIEPGDLAKVPFGFLEGWISDNEDNKVSIKFVEK